jgi:hypothetical protein
MILKPARLRSAMAESANNDGLLHAVQRDRLCGNRVHAPSDALSYMLAQRIAKRTTPRYSVHQDCSRHIARLEPTRDPQNHRGGL